jgi:sugar transferase (PEP-CTERM/EpsH1 system associated)
MKLLFLAHRIPYPPNKGDKIRSFHELRALAERGHEVHLLAFADDARDLGYQVDLAKFCASVQILPLERNRARWGALRALFSRRPLSLGYYSSAPMRHAVQRKLVEEQFDAVFVYSSTLAQYVPRELAARTLVDLVDADSEKWRDYARRSGLAQSWLYRLEWKRLRRYEREIVTTYAYTLLATPREAALLDHVDEFTRRARLRTLTNGIDLVHFRPEAWRLSVLDKLPCNERQWFADPVAPRLVFTGAMDYYANVDGVQFFVKHVLPLVREHEPHTEFLIVGSNPTEAVRQLARQAGVRVTGFVEDVRPYLQAATVCVAPLRIARGVQNKVLEAMAAGKAIAATAEGVAGLDVVAGEHLLIANSPRKLAEQIVRLIRDEALRRELGANARSFVETHHDWAPLLQRFVEMVESVAARNGNGSGDLQTQVNRTGRR